MTINHIELIGLLGKIPEDPKLTHLLETAKIDKKIQRPKKGDDRSSAENADKSVELTFKYADSYGEKFDYLPEGSIILVAIFFHNDNHNENRDFEHYCKIKFEYSRKIVREQIGEPSRFIERGLFRDFWKFDDHVFTVEYFKDLEKIKTIIYSLNS